jgi:hypothetical protein
MAGYSGTPLLHKLGIKPGYRIHVHAAPCDYHDLVGKLPDGAVLVPKLSAKLHMIHLFVTESRRLAATLKRIKTKILPDGIIWVSWPKKAARTETDVTEDVIRAVALPLGLVDVKVCAVDEVWSGLKLVIRRELREPVTR